MKRIHLFLSTLLLTIACLTATKKAECQERTYFEMNLWQDSNCMGFYNGATEGYRPTLRIYLPDSSVANGKAVVACPGGSYAGLAIGNEGYGWAPFFNNQGVALIVLKYRMPHGISTVPSSDAEEALRIVRANAKQWHIDATKVGIMGSSAGGHLASTVATHGDSATRPAFQILFYPVITMDEGVTHADTRRNLIGDNASKTAIQEYSNERQVKPYTPKAILLLPDDDALVPPENSIRYYMALREKGISATLHIYPTGGHGFGSRPTFRFHNEMEADLKAWIEAL
ncbi:MAG: alpha/beta hydrolase [Bacteroidales bacterium]|nr:alpha/beta hydrolase [Candidatus Colimorpha onthohippi]